MNVPPLYKYVTADRIDILENQLIRYTQPGAFNDPFEMPVFIEGLAAKEDAEHIFNSALKDAVKDIPEPYRTLLETLPIYKRGTIIASLEPLLRSQYGLIMNQATQIARHSIRQLDQMIGVLSLTECPKNLLMWAHYAGEHTGFLIEVDPQHATFNERRSEDDDFRHLRKVQYSDIRPKLQMAEIEYVSFLLTKSTEWSYEKEWRIAKIMADVVIKKPIELYNICSFEFPANCIKSIILGARSNGNLLSRMQTLRDTRADLRHVRIRKAELDKREFKLNIRSI